MEKYDLNDIELREEDQYHDYMEEIYEEQEREFQQDFFLSDDYIYHTMWPLYFLTNWQCWH